VNSLFRVSGRREDTFVAGLSMGGYGAFTWALRQPGRFAAAANLSGAATVTGLRTGRDRREDPRMFERIFDGREIAGSPEDLSWLLGQADAATVPALYVCCGTEDPLIDGNRAFADAASAAGIPLESSFGPGHHDWAYWDTKIQDVLTWLPLEAD
jgi:S-formylglutathione hydrolase FrmB